MSFTTVAARDLVQSYARNLADQVDPNNKPLAGLRMEIPERLLGDFKGLEQYGHAMHTKHGKEFKRHIKMDDSLKQLYMDVYLPRPKAWARVDMSLVKKDNANRLAKKASITEEKMLMTCDSGVEQEQSK